MIETKNKFLSSSILPVFCKNQKPKSYNSSALAIANLPL